MNRQSQKFFFDRSGELRLIIEQDSEFDEQIKKKERIERLEELDKQATNCLNCNRLFIPRHEELTCGKCVIIEM